MSELKKIGLKIPALIPDIILLGYKVIRQVSLPNRKKKGNLLSSLFAFFIAIIERLNFCEHGLFNMAAVFRRKYVRQTIFIIGFILFLLSLFEWTGAPWLSNNIADTSTEQLSVSVKQITIAKHRQAVSAFKASTHYQLPRFDTTFYASFTYISHQKKFLLNCSLRI